ncbi:Myotubularin phosphatase domain-containing protein [Meloidogyne graminicola]|uniref:Myotubularin phosphatase domain-containing protein n=1 Tax=Meloidogyne graminicola TaxID=189291 RepID=A0A8S9ZDB8_9BILA|nr:Myotubularin phosphatase domain-containing protein [Meloidogyne graminicola]
MQNKNRFSYNQAVNYSSIDASELTKKSTKNSHNLIDNYNGHYIVIGENVHHSPVNEVPRNANYKNSPGRSFPFNDLELMPPRSHAITWLLPGEELHLELCVIYHNQQNKREELLKGYLYVTNYRLRFEERVPEMTNVEPITFDVNLGCISKIEKIGFYNVRGYSKSSMKIQPYGIYINCKKKGNDSWRLSLINKNYDFAGTYPSLFFVPSVLFKMKSPDDFLRSVSKFRSKKRIPVLSWIDYNTSAALVRSSQPLVGALSRKSASDEELTKWLAHLQTILDAAALAAREIFVNKNSVLVHCSDGWDRTAQITSLTMLQLDPFYRTIQGFAVLIEKEWCSFGHKFGHRIGHGQEKPDDKERSPIFVQFIDCVWQLYNQFTSAFEFNVRFLKTILDELYSCRFGTFLYNCERERSELQVKLNTISLWSYILENKALFVNDKYDLEASLDDFISLKTKVYPRFWTDYYCRYSQLIPREDEDLYSLFDQDDSTDAMTILNGEITRFKVIDSGSSESDGHHELNDQNESEEFPRFRLSPAISPTYSQQIESSFSFMPQGNFVQNNKWMQPSRILQQHGKYSFIEQLKEQLPDKYYNLPSSSTLSECKNETKF